MPDRVSQLLKIYKVELEEIENNVIGLVEYCSQRFDKREITNYVWMENRALLFREISCVKEMEKDLAVWTPSDSSDPYQVLDELTKHMKDLAKERDYPGLVGLVLDRIKEKVLKYLEY